MFQINEQQYWTKHKKENANVQYQHLKFQSDTRRILQGYCISQMTFSACLQLTREQIVPHHEILNL